MELFSHGILKNNFTGNDEDYYISKLDLSHLDKLIEFEKLVLKNIERKDLYAGVSIEEFKNLLDGEGLMVGAFVNKEIVGFYSILFPGNSCDNLGKDIGISEKYMFDVAHLEAAAVHPNFRGNSLQKKMIKICLEQAMKIRNIKYLCVTISPYNYPSINHMFAFGLYIKDLKIKYDDMLRYIGLKNMDDKQKIIADSIVEIESTNHNEQLKFLKKGYVGFRLQKIGDKNFISFGKLEVESKLISLEEIEILRDIMDKLHQYHNNKSVYFSGIYPRMTFEKRIEEYRKNFEYGKYRIEILIDMEEVIGFCIAYTKTETGKLEMIFVDEEYRGRGLGKKLINNAKTWFNENQVSEIELSVIYGNKTQSFYRKFGFYPSSITMTIKK